MAEPTRKEVEDALNNGVSQAADVGMAFTHDVQNKKEKLAQIFKDSTEPAIRYARTELNTAYDEYVDPHVSAVQKGLKTVAQTVKDSELGQKATEYGEQFQKAAAPAFKKVGDFTAEANEKSGGFLETNKGLLFGGAIALGALFFIEGGFLPMAIAAISLIGGGLADDKGLFSKMIGGVKKLFGGDTPAPEKDAPSESVGKEQKTAPGQATTPQAPAPEATPGAAQDAGAGKPAETPAPSQTGKENPTPAPKVEIKRGENGTVTALKDKEPQTPPQNPVEPVKSESALTDNKIRLSGEKTTFTVDEKGDIASGDKPGSMRVRVNASGEVLGVAIVDYSGKANVLIGSEQKVTLPVTDGHIDLKDESVRASLESLYKEREKKDLMNLMDKMNNTSNMMNVDTASVTPQAGLPPKLAGLNNGRMV